MKVVIQYAKEKGLLIVPVCPFAVEYFKRHPEYDYILAKADQMGNGANSTISILRAILKNNIFYISAASILLVIGLAAGVLFPTGGGVVDYNSILDELEPLFQFYTPYSPFTVIFLFLKNSLTCGHFLYTSDQYS